LFLFWVNRNPSSVLIELVPHVLNLGQVAHTSAKRSEFLFIDWEEIQSLGGLHLKVGRPSIVKGRSLLNVNVLR
jgi:hypothetical protein